MGRKFSLIYIYVVSNKVTLHQNRTYNLIKLFVQVSFALLSLAVCTTAQGPTGMYTLCNSYPDEKIY